MDVEQQAFPTLRPGGSIVSSRSRQFIDEILAALGEGARDVLIDMSDVTFISKAAVVGIVEISEQLETEGGVLALTNLRGVVRNLISLRRSSRTLRLFDSEREARSFLRKRIQERAMAESEVADEEVVDEEPFERLDKVIEFLGADEAQAAPESPEEIVAEPPPKVEPEPDPEPETELQEEEDSSEAELPSAEELAQGTFAILSQGAELTEPLSLISAEKELTESYSILKEEPPQPEEYAEPVQLTPIVSEEEEVEEAEESPLLSMSDEQLSHIIKEQKGKPEPAEEVQEDAATEVGEAQSQPAGPETVFPVYDFDELAERLRSPDPKMRWFAARGLGRLGDPRGSSLLQKLLDKRREFQFIREMARISLRRLGQPRP